MKIFIADDDLTNRSLLGGLLRKWGFEVLSAVDGQQAWAHLSQAEAPRLAILDWMMPGMDGVQLCRALRAQEGQYPYYLILLTAKSHSQDIVQALEAGADDYVTKPFDLEELRARIRVGQRVLDLQAKLREHERLRGVLQTSRAVCHEMNQPLQAVLGFAQLLLMNLPEKDPKRELLLGIQNGVERLGQVTEEVMKLTHAQTKEYLGNPNKITELTPTHMFTPNPQP